MVRSVRVDPKTALSLVLQQVRLPVHRSLRVSVICPQPAASALQHQALARAAVEPPRVERIQARGAPSLFPAVVQGLVFSA
jgi:hypothetical protein